MSAEKLPPTPGPRCGEPAGHRRHRNRGEKPCDPCRLANQAAENERRRARRAGIPPTIRERWDYAGPKPTATQAFLDEVAFLVDAGQGWHAITRALNTTPAALARRLTKHGRYDLTTRLGIAKHQLEQDAA
jgi:hypothetical protein